MQNNLYYLFISGIILGTGPCLAFCAPILTSYLLTTTNSVRVGVVSYFLFSFGRLVSYIALGIICAMFNQTINYNVFSRDIKFINIFLGLFIIFLGVASFFKNERLCSFSGRSQKNGFILGILTGISPCLPLLGILNYLVIISKTIFQGVIYSFSFGLGTVISPLIFIVILSLKLKNFVNLKIQFFIRLASASMLVFLGLNIILKILGR